MNIKNLKRASRVEGELTNIDRQIASAELLVKGALGSSDGDSEDRAVRGFYIQQHSDSSGTSVGPIYKDGNYPQELYLPIAKFALKTLVEYRENLVREIDEL